MYQGTTPTYILTIPGHDLTSSTVYVTIATATKQFTLTGDSITVAYDSASQKTTIVFGFTQVETFMLPTGSMQCQVRWIESNGQAYTTNVVSLTVNTVLLKKVITYETPEVNDDAES